MLKLITSSSVVLILCNAPIRYKLTFYETIHKFACPMDKSVYGNGEKALFPFRPSMNVLDCKSHDQNSRQIGDASTTVSERQLE